MRWGEPGYALFASPASTPPAKPGQPGTADQSVELGAPDRWWVIDAHGSHLILYALWNVMPFAEGVAWSPVTLAPTSLGDKALQEARVRQQRLEHLLNELAPEFFMERPGESIERRALAEALAAYLPRQLMPQYRALVPDFFAWVDA
jgi:hypothetical protein